LNRLAIHEVEQMVSTIFALTRPVRAEFLDTLYALTEGNPFFIEEVLKLLIIVAEVEKDTNDAAKYVGRAGCPLCRVVQCLSGSGGGAGAAGAGEWGGRHRQDGIGRSVRGAADPPLAQAVGGV
jgi:hypothetical protein